MKSIFIILATITLVSCSVSPFSNTPTGRSIGAGKTLFAVGNVASNYYTRFGVGISQDIDAGYNIEFGNFVTSNFFFRYSIINQQSGPAWGVEYGFGGTDKSDFKYLGTTLSLNFDKVMEFYINARFNSMYIDTDELSLGENISGAVFTAQNVDFLYTSVGMTIWLNEFTGLNIYVIKLMGENVINKTAPFGASVNVSF